LYKKTAPIAKFEHIGDENINNQPINRVVYLSAIKNVSITRKHQNYQISTQGCELFCTPLVNMHNTIEEFGKCNVTMLLVGLFLKFYFYDLNNVAILN
jgi:hypothetical protein